MDFLLVAGGLVLLFLGGEFLVRGAVALAQRLGISTLVIALTVVAFGTSSPELIVSVGAALRDVPELAIGNIVGSNIANVLLVLGLPAIIAPLGTSGTSAGRDLALIFAASVLFTILSWNQVISWREGLVMVILLVAYLGWAYYAARRDAAEARLYAEELEEFESGPQKTMLIVGLVVGGLAALFAGSTMLLEGAVNIALEIGISEAVIGLTLVAFGTSLPELVTSFVALIRKHGDVAIGNVLGSNLFNLLGVGGIVAMVTPIRVPERLLVFDMPVMIGTLIILSPFIFWRLHFGRLVGVAFMAGYVVYIWLQFSGFSGMAAQ
jgi:cation:H+ antiporter